MSDASPKAIIRRELRSIDGLHGGVMQVLEETTVVPTQLGRLRHLAVRKRPVAILFRSGDGRVLGYDASLAKVAVADLLRAFPELAGSEERSANAPETCDPSPRA